MVRSGQCTEASAVALRGEARVVGHALRRVVVVVVDWLGLGLGLGFGLGLELGLGLGLG